MNTTMSFSFLVRSWLFALCVVMFTASISAAGPAQFVIVNVNAPGVGLNDPTAVAPVGGNTGTTLGEQRLIAFQHAASIWSARLDSTVPIRIRAQFTALPAGVLGSAAALALHANFPNAPLSNTWYPAALANKLAGRDLSASDDINANFSTNFNFYLGLDNNHGMQPDLVTTLLHEFAHGLGFIQYTNLTTGAQIQGLPDVYNRKLLDTTLGLHWPQMTNAERAASATNWRRVVWDGTYVTAGVPNVLSLGSPTVAVNTPASVAGVYPIGTADFGPAVGNPNVSAYVEAAVDPADAAGPTTTDGCSPLTNAAAVAGKIALIERGTCAFALKARNATNAGAVAAMIYNQAVNANASAPGMGDDGLNGAFVLIPTVSLRRVDGLAIVGQLGSGVLAEMFADLTLRAGADALNRARVFSPSPVAGGSSISHYDEFASRNLLMEPASTNDLTHKVKAPDDLTFELLRDLGWTFPDADGDEVADDEDCNPNSDRRPTIVIGAIDTSVPNHLFPTGCTSADLIAQLAAAATNHGSFVSAVAELTNAWVQDGIVTGWQKGEIQSVAARYRTP